MKTFTLSERNSLIDYVNFVFEQSQSENIFPVVVVEEDQSRIKAYVKAFASQDAAKQYTEAKRAEVKVPTSIYQQQNSWQSNPSIGWVD